MGPSAFKIKPLAKIGGAYYCCALDIFIGMRLYIGRILIVGTQKSGTIVLDLSHWKSQAVP